LGLAAPHTWAASVMPVMLGAVLSVALTGLCVIPILLCVLPIAVLMQAAVNTINDYCDFIKQTDTKDNSDDPADAILVYHQLNPKHVLILGFAFLGVASFVGIYVTLRTGPIPLLIGILGGLVIVLYSFGRQPISYLPIGELVSGCVMGGLITLAVFIALSGQVDFRILYYATPLVLGIGMIMFTNNTSDIERDASAGRKTLSVLVGRVRAVLLYRLTMAAWVLLIGHIVMRDFHGGFILFPLLLLCAAVPMGKQLRQPLTPELRGRAMPGIMSINLILGFGYMSMILFHSFGT